MKPFHKGLQALQLSESLHDPNSKSFGLGVTKIYILEKHALGQAFYTVFTPEFCL